MEKGYNRLQSRLFAYFLGIMQNYHIPQELNIYKLSCIVLYLHAKLLVYMKIDFISPLLPQFMAKQPEV